MGHIFIGEVQAWCNFQNFDPFFQLKAVWLTQAYSLNRFSLFSLETLLIWSFKEIFKALRELIFQAQVERLASWWRNNGGWCSIYIYIYIYIYIHKGVDLFMIRNKNSQVLIFLFKYFLNVRTNFGWRFVNGIGTCGCRKYLWKFYIKEKNWK